MIIRYPSLKISAAQQRKFVETIEAGFWKPTEKEELQERNPPSILITEWVRDFKEGKNPRQILKTAKNLVLRAAEYANILSLETEVFIDDNPPETFSYQTDKPSDYFKQKTWR